MTEKYELPSLGIYIIKNNNFIFIIIIADILWIEQDKTSRTPILNIEFSKRGEMLAVSYDNALTSEKLENKLEKEGSYIRIYQNRSNNRNNRQKQ